MTEQRRFFETQLEAPSDACLVWPYAQVKGYGVVTIAGRKVSVHIEALERLTPRPTVDHIALHGPCHNSLCFNPRHLSWGTRAQNQADRRRDGTALAGAAHPHAKLTDGDVLDIRASSLPGAELAERYGVRRGTIYAIRNRRAWKHL